MKVKVNRIPYEERRRYVDLYLTGEYTLREVAAMGGFPHQTLHDWIKNGKTKSQKSRYINVKEKINPQAVDPRDAEIARLRAALEKAELRVHALDTMINVAEANLNIKIRKKAGAKQ